MMPTLKQNTAQAKALGYKFHKRHTGWTHKLHHAGRIISSAARFNTRAEAVQDALDTHTDTLTLFS